MSVAQDAGGKIALNHATGESRCAAPCPAEPALDDLVLELEEQAEMRRGTGAEISVTGDEVVTGMAGEDLDLGAHATPGDRGGSAAGPREEETPRWRRAPQRCQAPPGDREPQAGAEPVAELPDDGRRRERD